MGSRLLRVVSIFTSIDGEVNGFGQGMPSTFIRLAGCNLRCWAAKGGCDTPQALSPDSGLAMPVADIVEQVKNAGIGKVTVTGGEPLLQKEGLGALLSLLGQAGIPVSVETNGTLLPDCEGCETVGSWVYDHKCPSSGEQSKMVDIKALHARLSGADYIKFVIADGEDYAYALERIRSLPRRSDAPRIAFSPKAEGMPPKELVRRMLEDRLSGVQFNLQMHKYIWPHAVEER